MGGWIETYRGTVYRWEVDNVDHFTVAYYFARFEDATQALFQALGLDVRVLGAGGREARVHRCRVRYLKELRVGDLLHVQSGVIAVEGEALRLGHQLWNTGDGTLSTTVELEAGLIDARSRVPVPLEAGERAAAGARLVPWESPPPGPAGDASPATPARFVAAARDVVKPAELDVLGHAGWPAHIHRFSAANGHLLSAFGMTPDYLRTERRGFSTFEFRLAFPGVLRAGDLVEVQSGLLHVGRSSIRMLHRMVDGRTGEVVATLEQAGVHLDLDARRPAPLPAELRARAQEMLEATPAGSG